MVALCGTKRFPDLANPTRVCGMSYFGYLHWRRETSPKAVGVQHLSSYST